MIRTSEGKRCSLAKELPLCLSRLARSMGALLVVGLLVLSVDLSASEQRHEVSDAEPRHEVGDADDEQRRVGHETEQRREVEDAEVRD